jgi:DNA-directed RNA polymerase specialized sigma24 family protein
MKLEDITLIAFNTAAKHLQCHDADDVAQIVTMKILRRGIASIVPAEYVVVAAKHEAFTRMRAYYRPTRGKSLSCPQVMEQALLIKAPGPDPRHAKVEALKEALFGLSPQEMDAITWKSATSAEVGKRVGLSPDAVRQREFRVVKKLREKVRQVAKLLN